MPTGTYNCSDALDYMETKDFENVVSHQWGHGENLFWIGKKWTPPPSGLSNYFGAGLVFSKFYDYLRNIHRGDSIATATRN